MNSQDLLIENLFSVKGKTAVVTGGSSGIGEMITTALIKNGCNCFIVSRKAVELQKVSDELNKLGKGKCSFIKSDLTTKANCDQVAREVIAKTGGKIHILINNAGASWGAPFENFPPDAWDKLYRLNVQAIFYLTVALSKSLAKGSSNIDPGRVVNISSVASIDPNASSTGLSQAGSGLWPYNTSKAAVNALTKQLALHLGPELVTVNAILPGVFPSRMTKFGIDNLSEALHASHPMGRIGTPEDIAGAVIFLCGRSGAHLSGVLIELDGGSLLAGRGYSKL